MNASTAPGKISLYGTRTRKLLKVTPYLQDQRGQYQASARVLTWLNMADDAAADVLEELT